MSETVSNRFRAKDLQYLAELYDHAVASGLIETGSSSIGSHYNNAVEEVKRVMFEKCGVWPSNVTTAALWRAIGDPSATFYFGGYREIDGKSAFVTTDLYLAILVECIDDISPDARTKLDNLAKAFVQVPKSVKRFPLYSDRKSLQ